MCLLGGALAQRRMFTVLNIQENATIKQLKTVSTPSAVMLFLRAHKLIKKGRNKIKEMVNAQIAIQAT